jgi:GNAT superfamily N-acetyltransferase
VIEIRPIRQTEADDFLHLLCEAFDLDFARAKGVFFREPMFDIERKWALFEDGRIESILTTVPLLFGWGKAIGIAGVATRLSSRGRGLASALLEQVLRASRAQAEGPALLFAKQTEVYESVGFRVLDDVVRAKVVPSDEDTHLSDVLTFDEVSQIYDGWAKRNTNRLRRDPRRWDYWKWNLRVCCPFASGYLCLEGGVLRECITEELITLWPVHEGTEWVGLATMAQRLGVPIRDAQFELHLMGHGFSEVPQMFMTDQF